MIVEKVRGGREWSAPATPAYNADMQRTCGVDRMALVRAQRQTRVAYAPANNGSRVFTPGGGVSAGPSFGGGARESAQSAGLRLAAQRGYSGQTASCYASVFVRHAQLVPDHARGTRWDAYTTSSYTQELWRNCGVGR